MTNYRRNHIAGGTYFFTVNLADRPRGLRVEYIESLRHAHRAVQARHPFFIEAMVVLPGHLHAIWTLPVGDADYALRWRLIKTTFSRSVPVGERRSLSRQEKGYGSDGIGSIRYATSWIINGMLITFISIRSNTDWWRQFGIGRILLFIVL